MPQLKHMARFTTPVILNSDAKDKQISTSTFIRPSASFTEIVHSALGRQTQPLSVLEFTEALSRELGHSYDETYVRLALKNLVNAGRASSRKETFEERKLRSNGSMLTMRAALYWAPVGIVPTRTVAEAVPGLILGQKESSAHRKIYKYPTKKQAALAEVELIDVTPANFQSNSNTVVDYLIEKIVAERTQEIQSQLNAANAKLAKLQELFKSAI